MNTKSTCMDPKVTFEAVNLSGLSVTGFNPFWKILVKMGIFPK